ncbi:MAG: RsmE family RNA methyltransferase [Planctomycetota bacterium]
MHLHRFYCDTIVEGTIELDGSEAHHLCSVCRVGAGKKVELFDGCGRLAVAVVEGVRAKKVLLRVESFEVFQRRGQGRIVIAVSTPKGERFDRLISKCTELGVDRICPVIFERTVKQPANPKVVGRWEKLAIAAAKQCGRVFLPQIDMAVSLPGTLQVLTGDYPQGRLLVGSLSENARAITQAGFDGRDTTAFAGPEGGMTKKEENLLEQNGAEAVRLTDTVLRVETAGLAFAAVLAAFRDARQG